MSHPQHICFVTDTYPPEVNGVALTLSRLVQGLLSRGHLVSVVRPHIHTFFLAMRFPYEDWFMLPTLQTIYYIVAAHLEQ